jgi:PIN domain nuclease of toxin-antitoxin system
MEVVVDSHTLFWYLSDNPKLSPRGKHLIEHSERVIVPSIVIMEILYILEKNNASVRFIDFLNELKMRRYTVYPLDLDVITQALFLDAELEMHDRIIVATAQRMDAQLISKVRIITRIYDKTVW